MQSLKTIGTPQCRKWASEIFKNNVNHAQELKAGYLKKESKAGYREANQWLFYESKNALIYAKHATVGGYLKAFYERRARDAGRAVAFEELQKIDERLSFGGAECKGSMIVKSSAAMDLDELISLADFHAKRAKARWLKAYGVEAKQYDLLMAGSYQYIVTKKAQKLWAGLVALNDYVNLVGVPSPVEFKKDDDEQVMLKKIIAGAKRIECAMWWRRALKKKCVRMVENVLREIGAVKKGNAGNKGASPYVSKWALGRWNICQARNKKMLAGLEMVNADGEIKKLEDAISASNANPVNQRNELMTRLRGYEEVGAALNLLPLFFTLTCPSKYHARLHNGAANPKFAGLSPRDGAEYLANVWAKIRAKWKREGIKVFGFRVAEPHHDGTPHYHFVLYVRPEQKELIKNIFGSYALEEDANEKGAQKYRWDCVEIDTKKGSATGYISKYIAKNIDGAHVDWDKDTAAGTDDHTGVTGQEGAARVKAWSSVWGIRQFQQIGSVSVTVWRELRAAVDQFADNQSEEVKAVIAAANAGDWAAFVNAMGGAFVDRGGQLLRPRMEEIEGAPTRYGDALKKLLGFWIKGAASHLPVFKPVWKLLDNREVFNFDFRQLSTPHHKDWLFNRGAKRPVSDLCH